MPAVTIEVKRRYSDEQIDGLVAAVHEAMMEALRTPDWDRTIRFVEHDPKRFVAPPEKSDKYTIVTFDLFSGRSLDTKRTLYQTIV